MIGPTFGSSYCQGQGAKEKLILLMDVIKDKGIGIPKICPNKNLLDLFDPLGNDPVMIDISEN